MTSWFVQGSGGSDNNGGTSWAVRSTDTDGVTAGTNTLTSVAAKFVAGDVGHGIFIGGVNQWRIITVFNSATSIDFSGATIAVGAGRTWTIGGRFATVSKAAGIAGLAAGDYIYVAPGTYRETLTIATSGGNAYSTGTVSLTNGSAIVTGSGTAWLTNAFALSGYFINSLLAFGSDGVSDGTTTFTSAAGNFQASMVGKVLQLSTKSAYTITAVGGPTSITLDGSPSAGTGLTYSVMSGVGANRIQSVDSDTQITLENVWDGPTVTGVAYLTYKGITWIGDYLGTNTDGIGGVVRITGSDNDQTATRANAIVVSAKQYQWFDGFVCDTTTSATISISGTGSTDVTLAKCYVVGPAANAAAITIGGAGAARHTVRRCNVIAISRAGSTAPITFTHSASVDNSGCVVESCILENAGFAGVAVLRIGGITVNNTNMMFNAVGARINTALTVGQAVVVVNSLVFGNGIGFQATVTGELIENYNSVFGNGTARTNVGTGAQSNSYPPLFDPRWFFQLCFAGAGPNNQKQVISPFDLASYSQLISVAGLYPTTTDMRGTAIINSVREWGALEYDVTLKIQGDTVGTTGVGESESVGDVGDYAVGSVVYFDFTTMSPTTGIPVALVGATVKVYKNDSATPSTAGVVLTGSVNGLLGLNSVKIDTAADGTFYATGSDFTVVITAGTINNASAAGRVIGKFSLANRSALRPTTAGRTLVVDAAGLADANTVKVGPTGAGTAQTAGDIIGDTNDIQARLPAALVSGRMDSSVGAYASGLAPLQPTVAGRTLDVTATGAAGIDWGNVENQTTAVSLANSDIGFVQQVSGGVGGDIQGSVFGQIGGDVAGRVLGLSVSPFQGIGVEVDIPAIADAVWDEILAGHLGAGSTGEALNDAATGAAVDPLASPVPAAYAAGTAGFVIGTNLDTTVSSRLATAGYTAPPSAAVVAAAVEALMADGFTWGESMRLFGAALAGKVSGAPGSPVFRSMDDAANRIAATADASGNRTAVTLTP